ncbi:MAG: HEPN domain-containing protein [Syntrophaceae bacterium]|nr:HEPN domain-containing protein [Syntrophaceae bacterium]
MPERLIRKLVREGRLQKQEAGIVQIESLLKEATLDLAEAKKIADIAERATYMLAYTAMLKAGRALLLFRGYRPDDGAQHKTVVDVTSEILGAKYKDLTEQFETMRRKRNRMTYEAGTLLSRSEAQKAFSDAIVLIQEVIRAVKSQNPQFEFTFEL